MYEFRNECHSYSRRGCMATEYYIVKPNGKVEFVSNGEKRPTKFRVPDEYAVVKVYTSNRGNVYIYVLWPGKIGEQKAKIIIEEYITPDPFLA